jgi:hypothetical protein
MAITDMKGTVATTTGMVNQKPVTPNVPDMSKIKMPTKKQVAAPQKPARTVAQTKPVTADLTKKIQGLTNEDKATLNVVLSPSVSKVISKIAPEVKPLLDQFTKDEENVVLPVSLVKNFANRKYGGQTEQESLKSFINDLAGQMETQTTNVPPDNQMVAQNNIPEQAESGMNFNSIDSDISPQNMETV